MKLPSKEKRKRLWLSISPTLWFLFVPFWTVAAVMNVVRDNDLWWTLGDLLFATIALRGGFRAMIRLWLIEQHEAQLKKCSCIPWGMGKVIDPTCPEHGRPKVRKGAGGNE